MNGVNFKKYENFITTLDAITNTTTLFLSANKEVPDGPLVEITNKKNKQFRTEQILHIAREAIKVANLTIFPERRVEFLKNLQKIIEKYSTRITKSLNSRWWYRIAYFFGYRPRSITLVQKTLESITKNIKKAADKDAYIKKTYSSKLEEYEKQIERAEQAIDRVGSITSLCDLEVEEFLGGRFPSMYILGEDNETTVAFFQTRSDRFKERIASLQKKRTEVLENQKAFLISQERERVQKVTATVQRNLKKTESSFAQRATMILRGKIEGRPSLLLRRSYMATQTKIAQLFKKASLRNRFSLVPQHFLDKNPDVQEIHDQYVVLHKEVKTVENRVSQKYVTYMKLLIRKKTGGTPKPFSPQRWVTSNRKRWGSRKNKPFSPVKFPSLSPVAYQS